MSRLMTNYPLYRLIGLPAAVLAVLLVMALIAMAAIVWRDSHRLKPIHSHIAQLDQLRTIELQVNELALKTLIQKSPIDPATLNAFALQLADLAGPDGYLAPQTPEHLREVRGWLSDSQDRADQSLIASAKMLRQVVADEAQRHAQLLASVRQDAEEELAIAISLATGFPMLGLLLFYPLRKRFLVPLNLLSAFMGSLAHRDYSTMPTQGITPLLRPLFESYNHMVNRLSELEEEHRNREQSLVAAVRRATSALLEQQRTLASAQRLAEVGEVLASLAHELRNPLAGIQIACRNLRQDLQDPDHIERLELVNTELQRLTQLLNEMLNRGRQEPEPARDIPLARSVADLLSLVRYQVPEYIRLEQQIPEELHGYLPPGGLRQALLNLVMNAAQALGEQPGTVTVGAEQSDGELRMWVSDDGPGFPPQLLHNGIRTFASWRTGGTGLGLSVVRRFVRTLGGELKLANRDGGGACVTMRWPCREPQGVI